MKKILLILILFISANLFAKTYTVQNGDTLISILKDNFEYSEIIHINKKLSEIYPDFTLKVGQKFEIADNKITINYEIDKDFIITKSENNIEVSMKQYPVFKLKTIVDGEIKSSLFEAIQEKGEDDTLAIMLANIFEWEIDFFKDIRVNDKFKIIVEKNFCRGKFIGYGKILAADFINQGRLIRALYY
ncbi:MAG: hypothetical protein PWQ25_1774, partial [Deferribacteres bacterium]|nr:hypothetical protein [Deferribacteres bacterium]